MLQCTERIDAVAAYCLFKKRDTCQLPRDKRPTALALQRVRVKVYISLSPSQRKIAVEAVMKDHRPLYCFICLDKFSIYSKMIKHLEQKHLQRIKPEDTIRCPRCDVVLESKMKLQSHAYHVHSTVSPDDLHIRERSARAFRNLAIVHAPPPSSNPLLSSTAPKPIHPTSANTSNEKTFSPLSTPLNRPAQRPRSHRRFLFPILSATASLRQDFGAKLSAGAGEIPTSMPPPPLLHARS
ncbi:hypothetical protein AJ78_08522 [Emergomyces pasteurianus Ep9510]|uniref:C2H2-type domain-containing protein n=1 Tax=Emergomyces pasteurianus Ep9510 TaxID=1447872 RepID=A0A1J9Q3I2_9EURO|nr:hypothetical protein AJ78_08522 [Emergomyces pasteurianus Ep9510]